ncbi:hypothetical protein [Actinoplanes siamensis]|uniref:hypothetical protein n=1 Tax=Actinoplanes siamensis TaxID=1223317 RepID=UPI0019448382|nr:hypothetical protein [Actinoplanes siamensis]
MQPPPRAPQPVVPAPRTPSAAPAGAPEPWRPAREPAPPVPPARPQPTAVPPRESAPETAPVSPRLPHLLIGLALAMVLVATGGLVRLRGRPDRAPDPAVAAAQAATALRDQKAASLRATFFDQAGLDVTGDLTVAADGTAGGRLTDSGGGTAEFLASGPDAAVRGDQAWWARRDPARIAVLRDTWVRPEGYAFPVESTGLAPDALAGLIDWVAARGEPAGDGLAAAGRPAVGLRRDGWTVLFSRAAPHRLVWFGGPMRDGTPLGPVVDGAPGSPRPPTPPYLGVLVDPGSAGAPGGTVPRDPLEERKAVAKLPAFDVTVNATTCRTSTCSWTVTVTNTGTAAGEASVIASVTPGMPDTRVQRLGVVKPGRTVTTARMSFPNPAPTNRDVQADYRAQVYTPQIYGAHLDLLRRLQEKGLVPGRSRTLSRLDPSTVPTMLFALDAMGRAPEFDPDQAVEALENAVDRGALPEIGELVAAGRLENPGILYRKLRDPSFEYDVAAPGTPVREKTGSRRQLQIAAGVLRQDKDATVRLDGGVDILVHTSQKRVVAIAARSVSSDSVTGNLRGALAQLGKGAPEGSTRVALLQVEAPAGPAYTATREYFDRRLCAGDADEVVVVNQSGVQRWTREQLPTTCR